jgi:hypothetical protein
MRAQLATRQRANASGARATRYSYYPLCLPMILLLSVAVVHG